MTEPNETREENPFQSPTVSEPATVQPVRGRGARGHDFVQLAFQFKFFGGIALLFGLLLVRADWRIGGGLLLGGAAMVVTGYGIGAYKTWGWYAGAVLVVPMLVLATILGLLFGVVYGHIFGLIALVVSPLYCYYIAWVLFSKAGRQRYEESVRAIASARANPDSVAGRLYRKR